MSRQAEKAYLKWNDIVIGVIGQENQVRFIGNTGNATCDSVIPEKLFWSEGQFRKFLRYRIANGKRNDVIEAAQELGLKKYYDEIDEIELIKLTRGFSLNDRFWIAMYPSENRMNTFTDLFIGTFGNLKAQVGDPVYSPAGRNEKGYAYINNNIGIAKKRLHQGSTDVENEVVVSRLARILGVSCCYAAMLDWDWVYSKYDYDINNEAMIHAGNILQDVELVRQDYGELAALLPQYKYDIAKMILLDFITLQTDRHLGNWGILIDGNGASKMSYLFDNGRSLFYDSTPEMANKILNNPMQNVPKFGSEGSYFDSIVSIREEMQLTGCINTNIDPIRIGQCFEGLNIEPWKVEAGIQYINWALQEIRELG